MSYEEQKNTIVAEYIKEKDMATQYYNDNAYLLNAKIERLTYEHQTAGRRYADICIQTKNCFEHQLHKLRVELLMAETEAQGYLAINRLRNDHSASVEGITAEKHKRLNDAGEDYADAQVVFYTEIQATFKKMRELKLQRDRAINRAKEMMTEKLIKLHEEMGEEEAA